MPRRQVGDRRRGRSQKLEEHDFAHPLRERLSQVMKRAGRPAEADRAGQFAKALDDALREDVVGDDVAIQPAERQLSRFDFEERAHRLHQLMMPMLGQDEGLSRFGQVAQIGTFQGVVTHDLAAAVERHHRKQFARGIQPHDRVGIVKFRMHVAIAIDLPHAGDDARRIARLQAANRVAGRRFDRVHGCLWHECVRRCLT